jgi:hypothetical protein
MVETEWYGPIAVEDLIEGLASRGDCFALPTIPCTRRCSTVRRLQQ